MKKTLLSLAMTVALGMASGTAFAANVAGVVWDPNSIFDFTTTDSMVETIVNSVGQVTSGYGIINNMNGTGTSTFCPGCELTYIFTGYTLGSTAGGNFTFSGGTIQVFVDSTPDYNSLSANSAGNGLLWLSLVGRNHIDLMTGNTGTLHSDPTPVGVGAALAGDGRGYLDVIGGLAAANFDTNTRGVMNPDFTAGFADFQFTSSFQLLPGGATFTSDDGKTYGLFGSNDFQGASVEIPEPGSLALLGLGLIGLASVRRRKSV